MLDPRLLSLRSPTTTPAPGLARGTVSTDTGPDGFRGSLFTARLPSDWPSGATLGPTHPRPVSQRGTRDSGRGMASWSPGALWVTYVGTPEHRPKPCSRPELREGRGQWAWAHGHRCVWLVPTAGPGPRHPSSLAQGRILGDDSCHRAAGAGAAGEGVEGTGSPRFWAVCPPSL